MEGERGKKVAHRGFLGHWNYCLWCNGGYIIMHLSKPIENELECKLGTDKTQPIQCQFPWTIGSMFPLGIIFPQKTSQTIPQIIFPISTMSYS